MTAITSRVTQLMMRWLLAGQSRRMAVRKGLWCHITDLYQAKREAVDAHADDDDDGYKDGLGTVLVSLSAAA